MNEEIVRVCAWCRRLTDADGQPGERWNGGGVATHGICKRCLALNFPQWSDEEP